jgi:hypothetical protein
MGYVFIIGNCFACKRPFTFNATWVPSVRDDSGVRQPVCESCMNLANVKREAMGLDPHPIHPDAYEPEESV